MKPLSIIFEDNHLLVIDKPCGLATMGALPGADSAARMAAAYLKEKYKKPGNVYVGVVSRLDALVSGILVLARTSKAASRLSDQIRQRSTEKRYLAIVKGRVDLKPSDTTDGFTEFTHHLVKNESMQQMQVTQASTEHSTIAILKLRCLGQVNENSILDIQLITGRKHQIRVQLAAIGHPILGDYKYGGNRGWPVGIGLHCYQVSIEHPTKKEKMTFRSLPRNWSSVLGSKQMIQIDQKLNESGTHGE